MSFNQFKKVIITSILVLFYVTVYSQEYVDLVSINYGNVFNVGYDNDNAKPILNQVVLMYYTL